MAALMLTYANSRDLVVREAAAKRLTLVVEEVNNEVEDVPNVQDGPEVHDSPMEVLETFRKAVLRSYVSDPNFDHTYELLRLNRALASQVSDPWLASNYSDSARAHFYRHVNTAFPFLIDLLSECSDERRATLYKAFSILGRIWDAFTWMNNTSALHRHRNHRSVQRPILPPQLDARQLP